MATFLIFVALAAALLFLFLGIQVFIGGEKSTDTAGRVLKIRGGVADVDAADWETRISAYESDRKKGDLKEVVGRITGTTYVDSVERQLVQGDVPMRVSEFLLLRVVLVVVPLILFWGIVGNPLAGLCAGGAGVILPSIWLNRRIKGRVARFNLQLADFLILIVNALRSGQTFLQGVSYAVRECQDPIRREFKYLLQETNLGAPIDTAMRNLALRMPSEDLQITCTAFIIQRATGGNLAEVLERVAETIRERVKLQGMIKVLTAQGILSGFIVGLLPFAVGIIIHLISPNYMDPFFKTSTGHFVLGGAVLLQLIGVLVIKKIVTINI
jgi:tight adherence protein B